MCNKRPNGGRAEEYRVLAKVRILLLALLVFPSITRGGISAPNSSVAISRDGERILVMLSPDAGYDQTSTFTLPDGRLINLHDTFPKSGVYNSSTLEPVWQVDWFSLQYDLRYSDDLQHLVRLNRQGFRSDWAIAFYDGGKLIRTYDCAFLLTGMNRRWCLPYSTWDWHTQWYEDFDLDTQRESVLLSTAQRRMYVPDHEIDLGLQEFYTFDLASGLLISRRSVGAWLVWAYGATAVALAVALFFAVRWLWRRMKASSRRRGFPVL